MRKGRSQRKARASLPPLSGRAHTSGVGAEASPPSRGPQVVIGITSPPPEVEEVHEARGPDAPVVPSLPSIATIATKPSARIDRLELLSEPVLEVVSEPVLQLETQLAEREPPVDSLAATVTSDRPSHHAIESDPFALASDPIAQALGEETPIPVSSDLDRVRSVRAIATPGELSIPPMGDLSVEPIAEQFFSEGELVASRHGDDAEEHWEAAPDKAQRKSLPHVVERRQRFSRYVRWAVSGAAVVCLAALARTAIVPHRAPVASAAAAKAAIQVEAIPAKPAELTAAIAPAAPAAAAPESVQTPIATRAVEPAVAAEPPKVEEPKPAAAAAPAEAPKADPATDAKPAVVTGDKTALQEKVDARRNLERGKLAESIEAGERSVALDPQDGEAWLLLGAAYQEKGKNADARRCYKACLSEGKRGPLGECRAMLH